MEQERQPQQPEETAITWRGILVAALMVLLWTFGCCFSAVHTTMLNQQLLMVLGFGAILTIFLLQFPRVFLVTLGAMFVLTAVLSLHSASPENWGQLLVAMFRSGSSIPEDFERTFWGIVRSLPVVLALGGLAYWMHRRKLRRSELVVIYAAVVIAIPWCISIKAVIESSVTNLFEVQRASEPQVYLWARELPWWGPTVPNPPEQPASQASQTAPATSSTSAAVEHLETTASGAVEHRGQAPISAQHEIVASRQTQTAASGAIEHRGQAPISQQREISASPQAGETPATRTTIEAVKGFVQGNGGVVPWRLWWRPILYWTAICFAFEGMLMGLLLMFRRRWIEHERLPFVWSQPAIMLIGQPKEGVGRRGWLLFGIGLAICLPAIVNMSPTGEPTSSWTMPPWAGLEYARGARGGFDLTDLNLLPGVNLRLFWGPLVLALFLLFPLDVLLTVAFTYLLVSIILPGIMRSMGMTLGPNYLGGFVREGLRLGGCIGLLLWSLWFNRRTLYGYFRAIWGGKPANMESDDELPRLAVFFIMLIGMLAFIALSAYATMPNLGAYFPHGLFKDADWGGLFSAMGNGLIQPVILTAMVLVFAFAQARQRVEGMPLTYDNNFGSHMLVSIQHSYLRDHYTLAGQGVPVTGSSWAMHWMQWGFNGQLKSFGPHNMLLEAFKIAHEFRVHARTIAKAILVTMLVVAAITPALYIQLMYHYGWENSYQGALTTWSSFTQWAERGVSYGMYSSSRVFVRAADSFYDRNVVWFNMGYGITLIGILFYLRREYPRFPVHPVGVVLAAEYWTPGNGIPFAADWVWFSFLLAGVAKGLTFRWVGVRSFREKVQPAVIMLICGMIFGMLFFIFRHVSLGQGFLK